MGTIRREPNGAIYLENPTTVLDTCTWWNSEIIRADPDFPSTYTSFRFKTANYYKNFVLKFMFRCEAQKLKWCSE